MLDSGLRRRCVCNTPSIPTIKVPPLFLFMLVCHLGILLYIIIIIIYLGIFLILFYSLAHTFKKLNTVNVTNFERTQTTIIMYNFLSI